MGLAEGCEPATWRGAAQERVLGAGGRNLSESERNSFVDEFAQLEPAGAGSREPFDRAATTGAAAVRLPAAVNPDQHLQRADRKSSDRKVKY